MAVRVGWLLLFCVWLAFAVAKIVVPDESSFVQLLASYGVGPSWSKPLYWCVLVLELTILGFLSVPRTRKAGLWGSFWLATGLLWANTAMAAERMDCGCLGRLTIAPWAKYALLGSLVLCSAYLLWRRNVAATIGASDSARSHDELQSGTTAENG